MVTMKQNTVLDGIPVWYWAHKGHPLLLDTNAKETYLYLQALDVSEKRRISNLWFHLETPPAAEKPNPKKLYLIGSLRNEAVPHLAAKLRQVCPSFEIFDDWYAAGKEADDYWKAYEQARGRTYAEALEGYAANHVFDFDRHHLETSSHSLLVLPAGKSGHMELMYSQYKVGSQTAILLEPDAEPRWDVMYKFIPNIFTTAPEVADWLDKGNTHD
jgi:hypothetical protein